MNQILFIKKDLKKYKIQLVISLVIFIILFSYWIYSYFTIKHSKDISKSILNTFNISRIYADDSQDYTIVELSNTNSTFVIGIIEIPKISIKYPILSDLSDELLKISPCKFYGPYPNQKGNLCIAAHNYDDDRFFGNLYKLDVGDVVNIYDSSNNLMHYIIYDKFESSEKDTSCINQNTNGKRELTLITCNNLNKNRLIIKAKAAK